MLIRILTSWMINAISFFMVSRILQGFKFSNFWSLILAGVLLGIVNATLKPIFVIVSLPISIFTFGLFLLIINGLMLEIVAVMDFGFKISSFWDAFWGAILLSLFNVLITKILFPNEERIG